MCNLFCFLLFSIFFQLVKGTNKLAFFIFSFIFIFSFCFFSFLFFSFLHFFFPRGHKLVINFTHWPLLLSLSLSIHTHTHTHHPFLGSSIVIYWYCFVGLLCSHAIDIHKHSRQKKGKISFHFYGPPLCTHSLRFDWISPYFWTIYNFIIVSNSTPPHLNPHLNQ